MPETHDKYTGYVARTMSGHPILEPSSSGDTGWSRLPFHSISSIEFWRNGKKRAELTLDSLPRGSFPHYYHTASIDSRDLGKSTLLSRSFGYIEEGGRKVLTVFEELSGDARSYIGF